MIHPLQKYFDEDALALVLALFCHLGSHRFVPWCDMQLTFEGLPYVLRYINFCRVLLSITDILRLSTLWIQLGESRQSSLNEGLARPIYIDYMRRFLRRIS